MESQGFGVKLRELRQQAGMTQKELADKVGIDFTYLSKLENAVMPPPSEKVILKLAEALNADKDELMLLAGKIPSDIAQVLKNGETLQFLRSDGTRKVIRASNKIRRNVETLELLRSEGTQKMIGASNKIRRNLQMFNYKSFPKVAIALVLVLAVVGSLWFAAPTPTRAIELSVPPASGTIASTATITATINIQSADVLPVKSVDLEIFNSTLSEKFVGLPLATVSGVSYTGINGSSASISAVTGPGWGYGYGTDRGGYGYGYQSGSWLGWGYHTIPGSTFGYGYSPTPPGGATSITYTIVWNVPSNWAAGTYTIRLFVNANSFSFVQDGTLTLSVAAPPAGGGGGGAPPAEEVTPEAIEEMPVEEAAEAIEEMTTEEAADILEEVTTETAADIIEEVTTETAADIIEEVATEKATDIIEEVATEKAADILEEVAVDKAADIMEGLTTEKLNDTIPEMSEESLTERLPELSKDKLDSIDTEVLFNSLPNAPTAQLTGEVTPEALEGLPDVVRVTADGEEYLAIRTEKDGWVIIAATPAPVDQLMIKTKQALTNVKTTVEVFEEQPTEAAVGLPAGQIVRAYVTITFENITPEDIEVGHMTFYVEKEWLEQNSIHKWSVVLSRYDSELGQWISLPTKKVREDDSNVYYTVVITHFSTFAISGSEALPSMDFTAANLAINPAEAETGETVTISADVTNLADTAGTYAVTLWINQTVETGTDIYLEAGETAPVSFTVVREVEGSYEVRIERLFGDFTVTEVVPVPPVTPVLPAPAAFEVSQLNISPAEVQVGEEVIVSATVANTGEVEGSYTATLKINGATVATKKLTIAGGQTTEVTFSVVRDVAASYQVDIDGQAGSFTVTKAPLTWWIWLIVGLVVVAVIVIVVVILRRRAY